MDPSVHKSKRMVNDDQERVSKKTRRGEAPMPSNCVPCEHSVSAGGFDVFPVLVFQSSGGQAFRSATLTLIEDKIMTALTQPNITIIGLYGSSYTRKHNIVKIITRRIEREGVFDEVVMASVVKKNTRLSLSRSPDVRRIQGELADKLGLQLHDNTTTKDRAIRLRDNIKTKDKILIILEDLWCGINLAKIGIPFGNDHTGCKILLVAENQEVLSDKMKTQEEYCVDEP